MFPAIRSCPLVTRVNDTIDNSWGFSQALPERREYFRLEFLLNAVISFFIHNASVTVDSAAPFEFTPARTRDLDCRFFYPIPAHSTQIPAAFSLRTRHFFRLVSTRTLSVQRAGNSERLIRLTVIGRPFHVYHATSGENRK